MKKHPKNKSNRQLGSADPEVVVSVPSNNSESSKPASSDVAAGVVKYDKNGRKIVSSTVVDAPKSTKKGKLSNIFKINGKLTDKSNRKQLIAIIVAAVLLLAAAAGAIFFFVSQSANRQNDGSSEVQPPEEREPEEPEAVENNDPLVQEPDDIDKIDPATYKVAAYKPRLISIPSLGLNNIPVTEVGWIRETNQLGSPKSNNVAGWFYRSSIPGERGTAIINAHGGDLGVGIFKTLPKIKVGDEVIVEMGDGRKFTYVVKIIAFKQLGAEADKYMNIAYNPVEDGVPALTLITCTGKWLPNQNTYDQRLYVRASLK